MKRIFFKLVAIVGILLLVFLFYQKHQQNKLAEPNFIMQSTASLKDDSKGMLIFESEIISQPAYLPAAHSSSFIVLKNGDLMAFWFAGTKEGNPDVKIWRSIYHDGHWSMATVLVDPHMIAKANHRYVIKVGNPVIYRAQNGVLHLFVVSVSVGGWSGSNLNHLQSSDEGLTWTKPERIVISPFFNISTLVRTSAEGLSDGGFYLPVYMELGRKYPELLRFDKNGKFIEQIRITAKNKMIQPSIMPLNNKEAWAYFRNAGKPDELRTLYASKTVNGGKTWSKPIATNLTNPDASIITANLGNGYFLMVYNLNSRDHLMMGISKDGLNWKSVYALENHPGEEFSYPAVQVHDKYIDILYTNNRKNIKHVRFNRRWLDEVINAKY